MKNMLQILLATLIALPAMNGRAESLEKLVPDCAEILGKMKREDMINLELLKDAKGIVILNTTSFSIGIGGSGGDGILMAKTEKGWSGPVAITTDGGTLGIDVGGSNIDIVILLMKEGVVSKWGKRGSFWKLIGRSCVGPEGWGSGRCNNEKPGFQRVYLEQRSQAGRQLRGV